MSSYKLPKMLPGNVRCVPGTDTQQTRHSTLSILSALERQSSPARSALSWSGKLASSARITVTVHKTSRAELDDFLKRSSGAPTALTNRFMRKTQWGYFAWGCFRRFGFGPEDRPGTSECRRGSQDSPRQWLHGALSPRPREACRDSTRHVVRAVGVEPTRRCHRGILSPLRLPVPPRPLWPRDQRLNAFSDPEEMG
jgi:hypothetical protein